MNKQEFKSNFEKFIKDFELDKNTVVVGAGAALMLLGLRDKINDIDVAIPENDFDRISKKHKVVIYEVKETTGIRKTKVIPNILGNIDIHIEKDFENTILLDGIRIYSVPRLLKQKELMNREKDQEDIKKLKKYLKQEIYLKWS